MARSTSREFEINQLRRRYNPKESVTDQGTVLAFQLTPSDPDFPFELDSLKCELRVPLNYVSGDGKPSLRVQNVDMERGYQINVEQGFDGLVTRFSNMTLLRLMNELDKNLESFLTPKKAQTVKLVPNLGKKIVEEASQKPTAWPVHGAEGVLERFPPQLEAEARAKRMAHIHQLEARLGRDKQFSKSPDGQTFTVPLTIPKPGRLPIELQSLAQVFLSVPLLYNLIPCTVSFKGISSTAARNIETAFEEYARLHPDVSLVVKLNHLAQNMHLMLQRTRETSGGKTIMTKNPSDSIAANHLADKQEQTATQGASSSSNPLPSSSTYSEPLSGVGQKPHVQIIPRPPEWNKPRENPTDPSSSSEEYFSDDDTESSSDAETEGGAEIPELDRNISAPRGPEKGILLSFPHLELHGVELLEVSSISVTVKCDRCKESVDISDVQSISSSSSQTNSTNAKSASCPKCFNALTLSFRSEPLHANSVRAGFLDLEGGSTVTDLLPSQFVPTCAECSTPYTVTSSGVSAAPPIISVRGETSMASCRSCHRKMTFKIPEVKFLRVSSESQIRRPMPRRRPKKENLGISAGQELPNRGRCPHYSKSYRWFRWVIIRFCFNSNFAPLWFFANSPPWFSTPFRYKSPKCPTNLLYHHKSSADKFSPSNRFSCCNKLFPCDRVIFPPFTPSL